MSSLAVLFMGMSIVFLLVFVVVWAIDVAGNWLILRKAGGGRLEGTDPYLQHLCPV